MFIPTLTLEIIFYCVVESRFFVCSACLLKLRWLSMMTPKYLYCLTISISCLPIWKVLCCFELVLRAIILVLARGEE